ncbi:MAG: hypothetical protein DI640_13095 [Sphingomonas taxi]|uniref:Uncharacterized protein n=1 Tax=Sphingomonas taxi TaxID=1549858 RepID=A0A2W4YRE1_9SPHN|nr:MAG: hypothetical protein DI640_13095 [Sphingomonas taxi]
MQSDPRNYMPDDGTYAPVWLTSRRPFDNPGKEYKTVLYGAEVDTLRNAGLRVEGLGGCKFKVTYDVMDYLSDTMNSVAEGLT